MRLVVVTDFRGQRRPGGSTAILECAEQPLEASDSGKHLGPESHSLPEEPAQLSVTQSHRFPDPIHNQGMMRSEHQLDSGTKSAMGGGTLGRRPKLSLE